MRAVDAATGITVTLVGAYALDIAFDLELTGEDGVPGPGLFPALLSAFMVLLGLLLVVSATRRLVSDETDDDEPEPGFTRSGLRRAGVVIVSLVVGVILLPILGFLLTGILLVAFLVFGVEGRHSLGAAAASILIPVAAHVLFVTLLGVRLPDGVLASALTAVAR